MSASDKFTGVSGVCNQIGIAAASPALTLPTLGTLYTKPEEYGYGFYSHRFQMSHKTSTSIRPSSSQNGNREAQTSNQYTKNPTSFLGTIFHLIFLSAGSAALLIPNIFVTTGFVTGSVTMLLIVLFYVHCMRMLLWSSNEMHKQKGISNLSYSDLVYETFESGPSLIQPLAWAARFLIGCNFIFSWYCGCILIIVLMSNNLQTICDSWLPIDLQERDIGLILWVPLLVLNMIRKLKYLEPCSTLGFIFNCISVFLVICYSAIDPAPWRRQDLVGSWGNVPLFMGVVLININITGLILSLKNEMKHPQKFMAPCGVMTFSYSIIFVIYLSFSTFFGLKYGTDVSQNLIAIIPENLVLYLSATLLYVFGLYLLFPLIFYVAFDEIWRALLGQRKKLMRNKLAWEYALRILLVSLAVILAYINPNINFFVSLIGTVGSGIDSIIYPSMIHSLVTWKVGDGGVRMAMILTKNLALFVLGCGLVVSGIQNSLSQLKNDKTE